MTHVSDAANTRNTDNAATQRNTPFVKLRKLKLLFRLQSFIKFPKLHLFAGILLLIFCVPFQSHAIVLLGSPGPAALSQGLVGYWPLDGAVTNWRTNTTANLSGNNNTGTLVNMSTSTSPTAGKIGQAMLMTAV